MSYVLSIDPGMSNGVCLFSYGAFDGSTGGDGNGSFRVEQRWQFPGGAETLSKFIDGIGLFVLPAFKLGDGTPVDPAVMLPGGKEVARIVMEKFTPRPHESFSLTQASVEPLRGEGVMIGKGFLPFIDWQEPSAQYFMGDSTMSLPEKKKASREFLKLNGLYVTGKEVGQPDADDAISATLHGIAWLRKKRHMPTLVELFGKGELL